MDKPIAPRTFAAADARRAAAARAARAAASARRAAAAKRRMVLTLALLGLSSVAWVLVAMLPQVSVPVALAPTLLLTLTLVLGRRAALQGAAADARMAAEVANAERRAAVTASAAPAPRLHVDVNPADLIVEPEARTLIASAPVAVVRDREWTPVPVPPPAYTLKAAAPRRKIEPLVVGVDTQPAKPSDALTEFIEPVVVPTSPEAVEPVAVAEPALNVQEVLARRRAVG